MLFPLVVRSSCHFFFLLLVLASRDDLQPCSCAGNTRDKIAFGPIRCPYRFEQVEFGKRSQMKPSSADDGLANPAAIGMPQEVS